MRFVGTISNLLGASNPARYFKGTFWIIFTRVISMGISLITAFYIARTLGPQNFGELSYALSIISLLAFLSTFANSIVVCRNLVRNPEQQNTILGSGWVLSSFGTIASLILVIILILIFPHNHVTILVIAILSAAQLLTPFQITQNVFFARADTKNLSLGQLFIHICISSAKVLAMINGQGVVVLAGIIFIEQLLSATVFVYLYKKLTKDSLLNWAWDKSYAKKLALDGLPFVIVAMSVTASARIDQVFIKHYIDTATVGLYSVAVQFTEIWQVFPQMFIAALYPALVNAHTSNQFYKKRAYYLALLVIGYSGAASFATFILAPYVIPIIYGQAFLESIGLLQIYIWSLFGTVMGFLVTNLLITENLRKIQIAVGVVPMIINVILNILWIPIYGAEGAAWATVISYSITPLIPFFFTSVRQKLIGYATNKSTNL